MVRTIFLGYAAPSTGPVPRNAPEFYTAAVPGFLEIHPKMPAAH